MHRFNLDLQTVGGGSSHTDNEEKVLHCIQWRNSLYTTKQSASDIHNLEFNTVLCL